ncbi:hypothetical protein LTR37_010142 [Vermiconidia calcicola]|uniref:Uncharacterized protein n=1 Tax=Vermiconidia calcicola TaxID=1690605 RepID=A0ACC3N6J0_9PEZI|nr:hypothetical protein LTR37_010142 [Vermiconidia calcicola]
MKSTTFSLLALPALFLSTFAAPAAHPDTAAVERRQVPELYTIADQLYNNIHAHTANIMATTSSITDSSTTAEKDDATSSVRKDIEQITTLINAANADVQSVGGAGTTEKLARRQAATDLAQVIAELIADISNALDAIETTLGLGALLGLLNPLTLGLSGLLLSLQVLVDNILVLVRQIVDGLLTGLAGALAGLPI